MNEKLIKIIATQLDIDAAEIKAESRMIEDLGADSLDVVELVMSIEEEFGIEIPDEDAEDIKTVAQMNAYIERRLNG